ncbi:MAG: hypothetical protein ACOC1K_07930 [Nanoarchaeota archaeon]
MVTKIKGDTTISEDSMFRLGWFSINGKKINVPLQTTDLNQTAKAPLLGMKKDLSEFNEIFRVYSKEKLNSMHSSGFAYRSEESKIKRIYSFGNSKSPTVLFTRYTSVEYPDEEQTKDWVNLIYTYSDVIAVPVFSDIFTREISFTPKSGKNKGITRKKVVKDQPTTEEFESYKNYLDLFIQTIRRRNGKPILGSIPSFLPVAKIRDLIRFYIEHHVDSFYIDFNTRMFGGVDSQFTNIQQELEELGHEYEKTFLFSLNAGAGRFSGDTQIIGAKDILTSGIGVDAIGKLHIGGGDNSPIDPVVKMKALNNRLRLFNKKDYGYYRVKNLEKSFDFPKDTIFSEKKVTSIGSEKDLIYAKLFNMEQLTMESKNLRHYIEEKFKPLTLIKKEKKRVDGMDIQQLETFKQHFSSWRK